MGQKGRVEITFYNNDDLDRVLKNSIEADISYVYSYHHRRLQFDSQSSSLSALDRQDIQLGREALLHTLSAYKKIKRHMITVVFDGTNAPASFPAQRSSKRNQDEVFPQWRNRRYRD